MSARDEYAELWTAFTEQAEKIGRLAAEIRILRRDADAALTLCTSGHHEAAQDRLARIVRDTERGEQP